MQLPIGSSQQGAAAGGEDAVAIAALQQAIRLNPAMGSAWRKLGALLARNGDCAGADAAYMSYIGTAAKDAELLRAAHALLDGKLAIAERRLRARLKTAPDDVAAMRMLAETCMGMGRYPEAEILLENTLALAPSFVPARHNYALVLFRQGKAALALPHIERLLAKAPRDANYRTLMASCLAMVGEYGRAIIAYEDILREVPQDAAIWLSYGNALRHGGRRADSVRAYRTCIGVAPQTGEAYWNIANLKNEKLSDTEISALREHLANPRLSPGDRLHMHYALGFALEQEAAYAESFVHYAEGARIRRKQIRYDADETSRQVRSARELLTPAFFVARAGWGSPDASPIFVLGMPRAGSTLIEQILSSHSAIEGTKELPEIGTIAADLMRKQAEKQGVPYPECLAQLTADECAALGARYTAQTRIYRRADRPFFVDKMPGNWAYADLIHLILPRAKIIDARRHPMASCFAAFKQYFAHAQNFSYDLTELGRYYRDYVQYMKHFDTVLPGRVHRVSYETMVTDTEAEIRRLLAYCEVPFEPNCLRFWETDRAVTTASSEQVRQPIFREGLDLWRHYEPWLGPLKAALEAT